MTSLILQTASRLLQPLLLFFSVFLLVGGHDAPGGGFVGGLTAAAAYSLHALAYDIPSARRALHVDPRSLAGAGLVVALGSAVHPLVEGRELMSAEWARPRIPGIGPVELGSPLFFDIGVYLVVVGAALTVIFALGEE